MRTFAVDIVDLNDTVRLVYLSAAVVICDCPMWYVCIFAWRYCTRKSCCWGGVYRVSIRVFVPMDSRLWILSVARDERELLFGASVLQVADITVGPQLCTGVTERLLFPRATSTYAVLKGFTKLL